MPRAAMPRSGEFRITVPIWQAPKLYGTRTFRASLFVPLADIFRPLHPDEALAYLADHHPSPTTLIGT